MSEKLRVLASALALIAAGSVTPAAASDAPLQITTTITLALAAGFVLYLIFSGRRRRRAARRV